MWIYFLNPVFQPFPLAFHGRSFLPLFSLSKLCKLTWRKTRLTSFPYPLTFVVTPNCLANIDEQNSWKIQSSGVWISWKQIGAPWNSAANMFWSVNIIWSCWWYWWVWHPWLNCIRYNINQGAISAWSAWVFLVQGHHNLEDSKRRANKEFFFIQILRPPTSPPFGKNFWKASFFYDNFLSDFGQKILLQFHCFRHLLVLGGKIDHASLSSAPRFVLFQELFDFWEIFRLSRNFWIFVTFGDQRGLHDLSAPKWHEGRSQKARRVSSWMWGPGGHPRSLVSIITLKGLRPWVWPQWIDGSGEGVAQFEVHRTWGFTFHSWVTHTHPDPGTQQLNSPTLTKLWRAKIIILHEVFSPIWTHLWQTLSSPKFETDQYDKTRQQWNRKFFTNLNTFATFLRHIPCWECLCFKSKKSTLNTNMCPV